MLTDPKTSPRGQRDRIVYAVSVGLLAALADRPYAHRVGEQGRPAGGADDRLRGAPAARAGSLDTIAA